MNSANKMILAQKVAVSNLMQGKGLNEKGLECLIYFFQPEFFERNIIKILGELEFEEATIQDFYDKLVEALIKLNDAKNIFEFTKNIEALPKDKMAKAIIGTRDINYIQRFANEIEGAPIKLLAEEVCSYACIEDIYSFAVEVKNAPINILQEEFEKRIRRTANENTNRKYIVEFAKKVKGADIKELERVVVDLKDPVLIYEFAVKVESADVDKMAEALINSPRTNNTIIRFVEEVRNIKEEKIVKFADIIKKGEDSDEMLRFADLYECPNYVAEELIECAIML